MRTPHNRDDKIEGKQIGEDHREIEKTSAAILLAILKRILDSLVQFQETFCAMERKKERR